MEEILASIRRIIAEEGDPPPEVTDALPLRAGGPEDDILELTEMLADDGSVVRVIPGAAAMTSPLIEASEPSPFETAAEPEPSAPAPEAVMAALEADEQDDGMLSASSAAASVAALAKLIDRDTRARESERPAPPAGPSLDAVVRDMLRPMLSAWLDQNLPQLIERMVRDEIARLARDAGQQR
jgi:hypothetical protein